VKKKLKLYVWENVLADYYPGIMFALASSPDNARKLIIQKNSQENKNSITPLDLSQTPRCVESQEGFIRWGDT